ncbi:MAG TPA: bacterial transcriptional activator domain-containing protein, partial [Chloroflexota bacterium]|nr:bacterial transcriptional activator domain-containing protein [Chloroflexota bacterium]
MLGDTVLTFRRRKAFALLVYLVMSKGTRSREALASLLVDEASDQQAHSRFRNTLHAPTEQVGDYILVTRETVTFDRSKPYWLDADELQRGVLTADDPAADPTALERAVALYKGTFLTGLMLSEAPEFEGWQRRQQERLHRLFMQALHLLIQRALQRRDDEAAQSWIARLLEVEPWHEEAHRQLMRLLARQGQRQAALEQYEVCCCILEEELGRAPQSETVALYEALRAAP